MTHTALAARKRASNSVVRPIGRTTSGCSRPRSASPRTAFSVTNTASTVPRKSVTNIARPSSVAPVSTSSSMSGPRPGDPLNCETSWKASAQPYV